MIPRRVRLAVLIAFLCHGLFILTARYRLSYDAYTHMLFADHYARDWFSLWEPRWYTGFTVVSYPPLTHQLVALFVPVLGFDAAYALILWAVTSLYPLGVYSFARIFTGKAAAAWAALACAFLLPIYVTAHIFGQLPFLTSTLLALFEAAALARTLREGGALNLALALSLATATMAAHHATLLVQPFLLIALFVSQSKVGNLPRTLSRLALFIVPAILAGILVIWPFWEWGLHQTMQTPIDHPSRHNFLTDPFAQAIFFWPLYGPLVAVIPFVFHKWPPRFRGLTFSFLILFLLGLGGTTRLPAVLFGDSWEWLTYDRFAFWAGLFLLPFFGTLLVLLRRAWKDRVIPRPAPVTLRRSLVSALVLSVFAATGVGAWLAPIFFPYQPAPVDMQPMVDFLDQNNRSQWRYLTFGLGDQFAHLNLLTTATTIDGSYHTARTLPELRASGIGQVDTSYWMPKGLQALGPILQESGKHGVRWGFVNRREFVPELRKSGWVFIKYLPNWVQVWENPQAILPPPSDPPPADPLAEFSWGALPLLALISASALGALRIWPLRAEQVLRGSHAFLVGLIPVSLFFWYFRPLAESAHERIYFIYTDALLFLSDALVLLAVLSWVAVRISKARITAFGTWLHSFKTARNHAMFLLFILCMLASLSSLWSPDRRHSLFVAMHLWLVYGLFLSLSDWPDAWKPAMLGFCAALGIQLVAGVIGLASQSTASLDPLGMQWPGLLDRSVRGASIVKLAGGGTFLRAYGTVPHPNILGAFALVLLAGPAYLFLRENNRNRLALVLFAMGSALIAFTFSRAAWLGWLAFLVVMFWKSRYLGRRKLLVLSGLGLLAVVLALYPLSDYVFTRVSNAPVRTEQLSTSARTWLAGQALDLIGEYPLGGVGIGSFVVRLAEQAVEEAVIEPVHSLPLLVGAELGLPGLIVLTGLAIVIAMAIKGAQHRRSVIISAALIALGVVSLFDHHFWSLAPGRVMLGLVLGLWQGQIHHDRAPLDAQIPAPENN